MLLLDAGVWIASGAPSDPWHGPARSLVHHPPALLAALDLTLYEVANAVGARDRQADAARTLLEIVERRCASRFATAGSDLLGSALEVSAEYGLTAYDAAYVAAARRDGMTLVSTDVADLVSKNLAVTPDAALYP